MNPGQDLTFLSDLFLCFVPFHLLCLFSIWSASCNYSMLQLRHISRLSNKPYLSLEEFVFRQKVLLTYRQVMRIIYKHHEKEELASFARHEFNINREQKELTHRKYLLHTGIGRINDMAKMFGPNTRL